MGPLVKPPTICTVAELVAKTEPPLAGRVLIRKKGSFSWLRKKAIPPGALPSATRSGLPSPSKSAAATAKKLKPTNRSTRAKELLVKVPGVLMFQKAEIFG